MAVFSSDTFTDTAGTALTSHAGEVGASSWTSFGFSAVAAEISNAGRVHAGASGGYDIIYTPGTPASAEYDVKVVVRALSTSGKSGTAGRCTPGAGAYIAYTDGGTWSLIRWDPVGGYTGLGTYSQSLSVGTDYALKLEIRDAAKKLFVDGVERISSADNGVTAAGKAGVWLEPPGGGASDSAGIHLDNFVAEDISAGGFSGVSRFWLPGGISV